jgi:uncharacterized SAM-binding protein YcdF (DUF218 family)
MSGYLESFLPGSLTLFFLLLVTGLTVLALSRRRRLATLALTTVVFMHLFMSTTVGVSLWRAPLRRTHAPVADAGGLHDATAVVLLTPSAETYRAGGLQLSEGLLEGPTLRILEAARVYRLMTANAITGEPRWLILQGGFPERVDRPQLGDIAKDRLVRLGLPNDRIIVEPLSRTTYEHSLRLRPILAAHAIQRFVLITSPEHMWRASAVFSKAGFDFVASAAPSRSELNDPSLFWPGVHNLHETELASHEYLGLLYYKLRGWI